MQITPIPCLTDNYAYIINDNNSKILGVVDPSEAEPIISFLKKKNLKLNYILNTHHHFDHIGGNIELKKIYNAKIIGFEGDKHRIPGIDITLKNNEKWNFGNSTIKIIHIPGHTLGHICFFFEKEKIAFTGDTLFSLGCGRIFEGTYEQMFHALKKITKLPTNTNIYCGHEYTLSNLKFALEADDSNKELIEEFKKVENKINSNIPSLPTTLDKELKVNPFLRCDNINIQNKIIEKFKVSNSELEVFTALRKWKDNF